MTEALEIWARSPQKKDPPCAQFASEKETAKIKRGGAGKRILLQKNASNSCVKKYQKPIFLKHDRKWSNGLGFTAHG